MATQSELAQIQHILGKRHNSDQNPLDLSARKKSREYLDSHKDVEKRRRDRINTCLETIRTLVPLCHQLPRHRRVDKADLLDLAIIYLRMINQFLDKIGVSDVFAASHQQIGLFTSLEKWVREQGEHHKDVSSFTKEILSFLEGEMQTASQVVASQQTSGNVPPTMPKAPSKPQPSSDWMKHAQDPEIESNSYIPLGSDEEGMFSNPGDGDDRCSVLEDGVGSPANHVAATDFCRKCPHASHQGKSRSPLSSRGVDCNGSMMSSSPSNGYISTHAEVYTQDIKPPCVDKAVNTDSSLTNFSWPPETTFTLPIVSGKIILHTPSGATGANNLNSPVTVHAEIHSIPPVGPCQTWKPTPGPYHDETEDSPRASPNRAPLNGSSGVSSCSAMSDTSTQFSCASQVTDTLPLAAARLSPVSLHHGSSMHTADSESNCVQEGERKYSRSYSSETYLGEERVKHYAQAVDGRVIYQRGSKYSNIDTQQSADNLCNGHKNGPFSKRYLAGLCRQLENNNNENSFMSSQMYDSFPNASSSMKLKSVMVHRHQSEHVPSR